MSGRRSVKTKRRGEVMGKRRGEVMGIWGLRGDGRGRKTNTEKRRK